MKSPILVCLSCLEPVYIYIGAIPMQIHDTIRSDDFVPVNEKIENPRPHQKILCPLCSASLSENLSFAFLYERVKRMYI